MYQDKNLSNGGDIMEEFGVGRTLMFDGYNNITIERNQNSILDCLQEFYVEDIRNQINLLNRINSETEESRNVKIINPVTIVWYNDAKVVDNIEEDKLMVCFYKTQDKNTNVFRNQCYCFNYSYFTVGDHQSTTDKLIAVGYINDIFNER